MKIEVVATVGDRMICIVRALPPLVRSKQLEQAVRAEVRIAMGELEERMVEHVIEEVKCRGPRG